MKKKTLPIVLVLALLFGSVGSAFALNISETPMSVCLEYDGHGAFTKLPDTAVPASVVPGAAAAMNISTLSVGSVVRAFATDDPEFYRLTDDKYLVAANDEVYTMADRVELDVDNPQNNQAVYALYGVPEYLQDKINASITQQQAQGNEAFSIALYLPSFLEAPPAGVDPMDLQNPYAETAEYIWTDDYGNRHAICNLFTQENGRQELVAKEGEINLEALTGLMEDFVIYIAGEANAFLGVFGMGITALQAYQNVYGPVLVSEAEDIFSAIVKYDKTTKLTIIDDLLGCYTYKVYIDKIHTHQSYGSPNEEGDRENLHLDHFVRDNFYSENYDYSDEAAFRYAHPYAEEVHEDDLMYVLPSDGVLGSTVFDGWEIWLV